MSSNLSAESQRILAAFEAQKLVRVDRNDKEKLAEQLKAEQEKAIATLRANTFDTRNKELQDQMFGAGETIKVTLSDAVEVNGRLVQSDADKEKSLAAKAKQLEQAQQETDSFQLSNEITIIEEEEFLGQADLLRVFNVLGSPVITTRVNNLISQLMADIPGGMTLSAAKSSLAAVQASRTEVLKKFNRSRRKSERTALMNSIRSLGAQEATLRDLISSGVLLDEVPVTNFDLTVESRITELTMLMQQDVFTEAEINNLKDRLAESALLVNNFMLDNIEQDIFLLDKLKEIILDSAAKIGVETMKKEVVIKEKARDIDNVFRKQGEEFAVNIPQAVSNVVQDFTGIGESIVNGLSSLFNPSFEDLIQMHVNNANAAKEAAKRLTV